jgi:uncharacterized membrane protein
MSRIRLHLQARPHLYTAVSAGVAAGALLASPSWTTRALFGWNVAVWLYLLLALLKMFRADHHRMRRLAALQEEGEAVVLTLAIGAALASVAAIVGELASARASTHGVAWPHLAFAAVTIFGSWLLLPVLFALSYAGGYYRSKPPGGLVFPPSVDGADAPDYLDFLYFSFTIAVAAQTADVAINSRRLRRLVLLQSLLAFVFNAAILALTINTASSLIQISS